MLRTGERSLGDIFLHHISGNNNGPIHDYLVEFFELKENLGSVNYYIIDPFILPITHVYEPIYQGQVEDQFTSNLITSLCSVQEDLTSSFSIVTGREVRSLARQLNFNRETRPAVSFTHAEIEQCTISICCYVSRNASAPFDLHDRWLIQDSSLGSKGIHMGPSFEDLSGKDVTVTPFSPHSCDKALGRFREIWDICTKKRD